jgi:hypothetical protein
LVLVIPNTLKKESMDIWADYISELILQCFENHGYQSPDNCQKSAPISNKHPTLLKPHPEPVEKTQAA